MLRLQFQYLLSRVSVGFLLVSGLLLSGTILYASRFWEGLAALDGFRDSFHTEYALEALGVAKFILVATALFMNIHCFLAGNGRYSAFFISTPKDRIVFLATKLGMIGGILAALTIHAGLSFACVGMYLTPYFFWTMEETRWFLWLLMEVWAFGLLEAFLMQWFDSIFSGIPPLFLYWILETNAEETILWDSWLRPIFRLFPHLIRGTGGWMVLGNWETYALFLGTLLVANLVLFRFRDIK